MISNTFNIILIPLFIFSAAVQYNDPDPWVWMSIYLFAAWTCFMSIRGQLQPAILLTGIAFCIVYACWLFFTKDGVLDWMKLHHQESIVAEMTATRPWIEQTREFFGLLIVTGSLLINLILTGSRPKKVLTSLPSKIPG